MTGANHATVSLDGETLSSLQVELVSKGFAKVEISQSAQIKINKARKVVDRSANCQRLHKRYNELKKEGKQ